MDKETSTAGMSIAIVGGGNVATHLANALRGKAKVSLVNPHTLEGFPETCDVAIISVKDDAIQEVAQNIKGKAALIAHTSGSKPIDTLAGCADMTGVLYPMQTFTKDVPLDYSTIPFFTEGSDEQAEKTLQRIASAISGSVRHAGSEDRRKLHLAAVFACNFTNALVGIADDLLKENGMDYTVMLPLIDQTVRKLHELSPREAQTGPAARHDMSVIERQRGMLSPHADFQAIYDRITDFILNHQTPSTKTQLP